MNRTRTIPLAIVVLIALTTVTAGCGNDTTDPAVAYLTELEERDWIRHFNDPGAAVRFRTQYCNGEANAYGYPGINADVFADVAKSIDELTSRYC